MGAFHSIAMRSGLLLAALLPALAAPPAAEEKWVWRSPQPQGNDLHALEFIGVDTGYAAGDGGTVLKTVDGGATWSAAYLNHNARFFSLSFWDAKTGIAVGSDWDRNAHTVQALTYRTEDGGATWTRIDLAGGRDIYFWASQTLAPKCAFMGGANLLYRSMDGGKNWVSRNLGPKAMLRSLSFSAPDTGFVLVEVQEVEKPMLLKTTDGGLKWDTLPLNPGITLSCIRFLDSKTGYGGGTDMTKNFGFGKGIIQVTRDGGLTWTDAAMPDTAMDPIGSIEIRNAQIGFAMNSSGSMLKTIDGGRAWAIKSTMPYFYGFDFSTQMVTEQTGYAAGNGGNLWKTLDGGVTWRAVAGSPNINGELLSACFPTAKVGYVAGSIGGGNQGGILKTTDGGVKWDTLLRGGEYPPFKGLHFRDVENGLAAGYHSVLRTRDAGKTWQPVADYIPGELTTVRWISDASAMAAGNNGEIMKTEDGGDTWSTVSTDHADKFQSLLFLDGRTGFAVGEQADSVDQPHGLILKTKDGGANWTPKWIGTRAIVAIGFPSPSIGFALNESGTVYKSTDGGVLWNAQPEIPTPHDYSRFTALHFIDPDTGYVAGNYDIFKTTDGGLHWSPQNVPMYLPVVSMSFPDRSTGFALGGNGVLKLDRNASSTLASAKVTRTRIGIGPDGSFRYRLPHRSRVTVELIALDGKRILKVLDEVQGAGPHAGRLPADFRGHGGFIAEFKAEGWRESIPVFRK